MINPKLSGIIYVTAGAALLAGCGADDIASPGGGGIVINNPPAAPTPPAPPPPPPPVTVVAAAGCPTISDAQGLTDSGTISGPTGSYRVCTLPNIIKTSSMLPQIAGLVYEMNGRTDVGCDRGPDNASVPATCAQDIAVNTPASVTLTIAKGSIVYGKTGKSWLAVNRGNRLIAEGDATTPIVFTSRDNILGLNTDQSSGQWGGVVLLGRAPITDCSVGAPGTTACFRDTEGAEQPARYGGLTPTDNSGSLKYVQIRYSGFVLSNDSELQALTTGGVGSATQLEFIQSHNSSDDAAEFFGGNVNMKHFVATGAEDDNLDTDTGIKANFQYVLVVQRANNNIGDAMIEADSDNGFFQQTPRQNTRIANATFIQRSTSGSNRAAILIRGGADYAIVNSVLVSPGISCLRISRSDTLQAAGPDEAGPPIFRSFVASCGTPKYLGNDIRNSGGVVVDSVTAAQVEAAFGSGSNGNSDAFTFSTSLTTTFVNGAEETAVAAFDPSTLDSFFDATTYIGAIRDANDTWYQGWTCNSVTATFDNGSNANRACTSLPI